MHHDIICGLLVLWLEASLAAYQMQLPEVEFLSNNLRPSECVHFYESLRRQTPENVPSNRFRKSQDCKKFLLSWLTDPRGSVDKTHEEVELTLRQIGRFDLANWLNYNIIHQQRLAEAENGYEDIRGNMAVRYKDDGHLHLQESAKATSGGLTTAGTSSTETVLQKLAITLVVVLSMTTLCLCCYKFVYSRMRGGHFANFRNDISEESWLRQDNHRCFGASGSSCAALSNTNESLWNCAGCTSRFTTSSAIEYLKSKFKGHALNSREERYRQLKLLTTRLHKTCPTQKKVIYLSTKEQHLLRSLTDAEKHQLPATDSDLKFLVASNREKRKLLAREDRREFLIKLRKRIESQQLAPNGNGNVRLNETERKLIRKLSFSERLLLPIMDKELEILISGPLEKRQVMLRQLACKLAGISPEDRKYLELENDEKKFLKETNDRERNKLGITDSEFRFLVASRSQRNIMQNRLDSGERVERIQDIRRKLLEVNYDVSLLELSDIEHSSFLSLSPCDLARLGLTEEHVKYYAASDSERKVMWPSPSQHRNLRLNTLQTKLTKLPWKECNTRLTSSEHTLLASLSPREQNRMHISDSEKNFMLSTDSEKELIQRQRKIERLEAKIRDFNTVTMTESERYLILSLSPSEMQMLNIDTTNKSCVMERKSMEREERIRSLTERIERDRPENLTEAEQDLLSCLTRSEMSMMRLTPSQIYLVLSKCTGPNAQYRRRRLKIEMINDRIRCEGLSKVRLTGSETNLIKSMSDSEMTSLNASPSQLSFLLAKQASYDCQMAIHQSARSETRPCVSQQDVHANVSTHRCNQQAENPSHIHAHSSLAGESSPAEFKHKVQFMEPNIHGDGSAEHVEFVREFDEDSEMSETYDELGMLFSQQMKEQARPCQRKYCLLGRHLKKGSLHDAQQCQVRHHYCRGYPSDQRPSCSSGNVCRDTYDEFHLMHAAPHEKRQLNSTIYERRKQFLDQPCQRCPTAHDEQLK